MHHGHRQPRLATRAAVAAGVAAAVGLGFDPSAAIASSDSAAARSKASLEVADGVRPNPTGNDITGLTLYPASSQEPAWMHVTFANMPLDYRVGTTIFLDLDRDPRPDAAIAFGGQEWRIYKTNAWTGLGGRDLSNCGRVTEDADGVAVDLAPVCLGGRRHGRMAVSVESTLTDARTEYVPGRHKWSKKIRTYLHER